MLSEATAIPADALAGEVAIARKNRYLVGAERLQRRLEKWSWVLQNRARLYSGASNALAVPVVNAITPARFYSDLYIGHRPAVIRGLVDHWRSAEHTSELQSLMRISYAVFCLKQKNINTIRRHTSVQLSESSVQQYNS